MNAMMRCEQMSNTRATKLARCKKGIMCNEKEQELSMNKKRTHRSCPQ